MTSVTNVPSPCIDICDLDRTGEYCIGCGRSLDEIAGWQAMGDRERQAVVDRLAARLLDLEH